MCEIWPYDDTVRFKNHISIKLFGKLDGDDTHTYYTKLINYCVSIYELGL